MWHDNCFQLVAVQIKDWLTNEGIKYGFINFHYMEHYMEGD